MNKLLLALLLWLSVSACTVTRYTAWEPYVGYFPQQTTLYNSPTGLGVATVNAYTECVVVGTVNGWVVVRGTGSHVYYVPASSIYTGRVASYSSTPAGVYAVPSSVLAPVGTVHDTYTGPRGGQYYINGNGNKTYVTPQSTINNNTIYTGPRGGNYYINRNGNKTYIKR